MGIFLFNFEGTNPVYPLLEEGIKLTIIGTMFVFISLFILCLMIKILNSCLNETKEKEMEAKDLDINLIISASVAYFLEQSDDEIYIPKVFRQESIWQLESRINPIITGE